VDDQVTKPPAAGEAGASGRPRGPTFGRTFASLKHRNYRLWFWGQMTSLFGTWMQTTAQGYLVYELTHSAAFLGYVGFASGLPTWLLMLGGGVAADRLPRRSVLMVTQTAMMVLAFILAALAFSRTVQPWHILVLAAGLGVANAFDAPSRQAFVSELVAPGDLTNAIALNSTMFNVATAISPALAGITYAAFGAGWCFTINGISFLAVLAALAAMRIDLPAARRTRRAVIEELHEGITYIVRHPAIRTLIALVAAMSLFAVSLSTLVPAWAVKILHGNAATNGLLLSSRGAGSLVAALGIASLGAAAARGRLISAASLAVPLSVALFAAVPARLPSFVFIAAVGFSTIVVNNLSNALVQSLVPNELRGRVMGVYTLLFFGAMPLGALFLGGLAEHLGEQAAIAISAACAMAVALFIRYRIRIIATLK